MDSLLNGDYTAETTEDYGDEICNLPYLVIWANGTRKSIDKKYYTNDLDTPRKQYKRKYGAERIYLSYHEKRRLIMKREDFEKAIALENEIESVLLEQEAFRSIIDRIDKGIGTLNFEFLNVPLDDELRAKIRDHYQKKLAASIAKEGRLKVQFEGL